MNSRSAQMERRLRLRPMSSGEVLDVATRAYQIAGRSILAATVTPTLMSLAAFMFFWSYAFPGFWSTQNPKNVHMQLMEAITAMGISLFVAGPLFLIGISYTTVVTTQVVSDFMVGNVPNPAGAAKMARRKIGGMLKLLMREMLGALLFFLVAIGLLFLSTLITINSSDLAGPAGIAALAILSMVVGSLWMPISMVRNGMAPAAMLMENLSPRDALRRSHQLLSGGRGQTSGAEVLIQALLLIGFLFLLLGWGLSALNSELGIGVFFGSIAQGTVFQDVIATATAYLPWFLVIWLTIPIWSTTTTILYYERRVRLEGYDIEVLAQDVWRSDQSRRFQL